VKTNIKNNILSFFPLRRQKMSLFILLFITTFAFSQTETSSVNKEKKEISTQTKNHIRKGNELYNQGKYVDAEREYKEAIALNPNYDKANYNYGNTQFLQNKTKEAKELYELTSKTTKDIFVKADSEHNLGNIAMKEKKYDAAVNAYKESLRNNPNDDETRYNLALAQKMLKEQQKKDNKDNKDDKKDQDKKDDKKDKKDDKKDDKDQDKKDDKDNKDDKKDDKDQDKKDDKGDKDKDKKDKKDDGKGENDKNKKEQQPKPQPSKLSPEQVKQLLEAMNKEENKTQKKINAKKERGRKIKQDKDW